MRYEIIITSLRQHPDSLPTMASVEYVQMVSIQNHYTRVQSYSGACVYLEIDLLPVCLVTSPENLDNSTKMQNLFTTMSPSLSLPEEPFS